MNRLIDYTEQLLQQHSAAMIPGFGTMIVSEHSAYIDPETQIFHPMKKAISFDASSNKGGDLLLLMYKKNAEDNRADAAQTMKADIENLKKELEDTKTFTFGSLGIFGFDRGGQYLFTPSEEPSCNADNYMFKPFHIRTAKELLDELSTTIRSQKKDKQQNGLRSRIMKAFRTIFMIKTFAP